jgi:surface carbohydrate biosynthesis protein
MKVIYLPCEIKTRELDSRVELLKALTGCTVVIGQQWDLFANAQNLPTGVILFKTVNRIQGANMAAWKAAGHKVAALDEESLIADGPTALVSAVSRLAMENCDLFLAHSHGQAEAISSIYNTPVQVVGNQRLDLCRGDSFKAEGDEIRAKHGKFILINTNYGIINSHWGGYKGAENIAKQAGMLDTEAQRQAFHAGALWEIENIKQIYEVIKGAPYKVILRPHPGENAAHWEAIPGIEVVTGTNPLPWLYGAEILIHTGCTTGLEAAIMGKRAINIQPVPAPTQNITPVINPTVKTGSEALQLLDSVDMADYTRLASGLFPSGATGKIAKALLDLAPDITTDFSQVRIQSQSRTALQRDKFSLSPEEAWKTLGKVSVLADSLFVRHA